MKTEVRNEFILEAHKSACNEWKLKIEKECPELFENKLEVGKWYNNGHALCFYKSKELQCGFHKSGEFLEEVTWISNGLNGTWTLATEEEVKKALINEAKKRGFKNGIGYKNWCLSEGKIKDNCWVFNFENNHLSQKNNGYGVLHYIFHNGKWAEIIPNPIEEKINDLQKQLDELKKQL